MQYEVLITVALPVVVQMKPVREFLWTKEYRPLRCYDRTAYGGRSNTAQQMEWRWVGDVRVLDREATD
jgi:hypothetical protein